MTLFDLALKNIRRNMKDYGLYIGSTIFSIVIYFTFVTLKYSEDVMASPSTSKQISSIMSGSAFVLIIFVAIFIIYSNSFFMKKRKKEVALYSLLGVRKKAIGFMLFFENLVIGLVSLVFGIVLGFLLSRGLLSILVQLMGMDVAVGFTFSGEALLNTALVFFVIFTVTSLQGYRVIYQFKLIDLFQATKKGEELPKARFITAVVGVVVLAAAYTIAVQNIVDSQIWRMLGISTPLVIIGLTVLGSYLLFHSVLVAVLSFLKKREQWAWRGLNLMTVSQLLYRIRGNAKTLTVIAILSATTVTAGGAVFGLYYNTEQQVQQYAPHTFMWQGEPQKIESEDVLYTGDVQLKKARLADGQSEMEYNVLKESDFQTLATALKWDDVQEIAANGYFLLDPYYNEQWSTVQQEIELAGQTYSLGHLYEKSILNMGTIFGSVLVVQNQVYEDLPAEAGTYQYVGMDNYKNQRAISDELATTTQFSSATAAYDEMIESSGMLLFVGSFLGLVFLVATGSIIFFKMMTEAEEDKGKYEVLRKIGVSSKEMKRTIRGQVGIIFAAPLVLGLLHAAFALTALSNLMSLDMLVPVVLWMLAYSLIYCVYYIVTVRSFYKTVREHG